LRKSTTEDTEFAEIRKSVDKFVSVISVVSVVGLVSRKHKLTDTKEEFA